MKILLSHRFFWPDTPPYATMLRSIAKRLAETGHDVTVFSTQPSYHSSIHERMPDNERLDNFNVVRMPIARESKKNIARRFFNLGLYAKALRRHILSVGDYDVVTASTYPPILAGRAASSAAKKIGARFIYHCMDLHPEVSLFSGQLNQGAKLRWLQRLDNITCQRADAIVVLSEDMRNTLLERDSASQLAPKIINNFMLEDFSTDNSSPAPQLPQDKFTILFAGNIGNFQNLDSIVKAAHSLSDLDGVQFWFVGEGSAKARLIRLAGALVGHTIFFLPHQPQKIANTMMRQASLNFVSLAPKMYKVAYPSKTIVSLSVSTPILAAVESHSELAEMVRQEQIGYVCDQCNPQSLAATIHKAYAEKSTLTKMRSNVKNLYERKFTKELILQRWCDLFMDLSPTEIVCNKNDAIQKKLLS